jgi:acyl transferase domain-containing protein/acetyltransferase-like isoleucine patch superfamily enzyme/acyl carrier protein
MACRFPGARNIDQYWRNLRDGVESVTWLSDREIKSEGVSSDLLKNPHYIKAARLLEDLEMFDARFFGLSPKEGAIMDPQHRHFLECSWEALEHAGHSPDRFDGSIGVFAGCGMNAYFMFNILTNPDLIESTGLFLLRHTGNDKDFLSTRVSYNFNLTGPSVNVQTACSTSLVAIHQAVQSLLNGECEMALAGGVTIEVPHKVGYLYKEGEILSPDGHCRAFDHRSKGTVFGSGVGVVVLRKLEDAMDDGDTIHAIVKGSAINNDGSMKVGYLAPSVDGQSQAITEALEIADVNPETISYVETHGTGTPVGDPMEVTALTQAYRAWTDKKGFCAIGSVKTNIGHLDTAAGVASFIKNVLSLKHKQLPPSLNFEKPNPALDLENTPFFVNAELTDWKTQGFPRRAGVSSIGVGGTNAHVILEEAPDPEPSGQSRPWQLLVWSARTKNALEEATLRLNEFFQSNPDVDLADTSHTLQVGRKGFQHRRALVCRSVEDAGAALREMDKQRVLSTQTDDSLRSVVFMFPGGGAQYPDMGRGLYESEPVYRSAVDDCFEQLEGDMARKLRSLMFPTGESLEAAAKELENPTYSILSIFIVEYALAQLWISWGVQPVALTGHSLGEYAAACLSGVMSLHDALAIVHLRGKIFERLPEGAMLSIPLPESEVAPLLGEGLSFAAVNAPELCVASGEVAAIARLRKELEAKEVECRLLKISVAAHSPMLEPYLEEFRQGVSKFKLNPPSIPFVSNRTGKWIAIQEATDPNYWVNHLRHTVRFADGMKEILSDKNRILLEVGPGATMSSLARLQPDKAPNQPVVASLRHPQDKSSDREFFLKAFGQLWLNGLQVDWKKFRGEEVRRRIPLPTYAWEHEPYWIAPGKPAYATAEQADPLARLENLSDWFSKPVWKPSDPATVPEVRLSVEPQKWLVFGNGDPLTDWVLRKLEGLSQQVTLVSPGASFVDLAENRYAIDPGSKEGYTRLIEELTASDSLPDKVIHLWTSSESDSGLSDFERLEETKQLGFFSLFHFVQALGEGATGHMLRIAAVTAGSQQVTDEIVNHPERALILGACKVIPKEFPEIACQAIDLPSRDYEGAKAVEWILGEASSEATDSVVSFREGKRWTLTHEGAPLETGEKQPRTQVRQNGVYLITGGLGGIGLAMAEYLARRFQARLVLTSRSGLPDRSDWDRVVQDGDPSNRERRTISKIRELESGGAQILPLAADVTDRESMKRTVETALERFGVIHGVFHAAGVLEDGLIALKDAESVERVLAPKVQGTLNLAEALKDQDLDLMVLFSSISSTLGAAGQVDYTAANDYLNAFARSPHVRNVGYTVAVNWGPWGEVGMAQRAAVEMGLVEGAEGDRKKALAKPLIATRTQTPEGDIVCTAEYRVEDLWVLDEHRIKDHGPLLPGTGYFELVKTALEGDRKNGPLMIRDLVFLSPLDVAEGETIEVRVALRNHEDHYDFLVSTRRGTDGSGKPLWRDHAQGLVGYVDTPPSETRSIDGIRSRCSGDEIHYRRTEPQTRQEEHLDFGPRWRNLVSTRFGNSEALACLELAEEFHPDLEDFDLHPALLDIATGYGLPLLSGYEDSDHLYVPVTYGEVRILASLGSKIYSHIRLHGEADAKSEIATFDVDILDEEGHPLIEVERFSVKRISRKSDLDAGQLRTGDLYGLPEEEKVVKSPSEMSLLELGVREGIRPAEGAEALERILSVGAYPEIAVCSLDLQALIEKATGPVLRSRGGRPKAKGSDNSPRGTLEKDVAAIWARHLGIEEVTRDDEFFDLGGHSLLGVRVTNEINARFKTNFPSTVLFEHPTVAKLAAMVARERPDLAEQVDTERPTPEVDHRLEDHPPEVAYATASVSTTEKQEEAVESSGSPSGQGPEHHSTGKARWRSAGGDSTEGAAVSAPKAPKTNGKTNGRAESSPSGKEQGTPPKVALDQVAEIGKSVSGQNWIRSRSHKNYRMRENRFCKYVLAPLYAIPSSRLRRTIEYLILKLEGRDWFTITLRKIYKKYYDIEIGDFSASCFNVSNMKRGTKIGRYCSIFRTARVETANHPMNTISSNGIFYQRGVGFANSYEIPRVKLEIGNDVWIGHNATILYPTKKIGDGAVIAAGAMVVDDVPPFAVVAGYPAVVVRYRFTEEKRKEILETQWWNASLEELESVRDEFTKPVEGSRVR